MGLPASADCGWEKGKDPSLPGSPVPPSSGWGFKRSRILHFGYLRWCQLYSVAFGLLPNSFFIIKKKKREIEMLILTSSSFLCFLATSFVCVLSLLKGNFTLILGRFWLFICGVGGKEGTVRTCVPNRGLLVLWGRGSLWSCCDFSGGSLCVGACGALWTSMHTAHRALKVKWQQMLWKKEHGVWYA